MAIGQIWDAELGFLFATVLSNAVVLGGTCCSTILSKNKTHPLTMTMAVEIFANG